MNANGYNHCPPSVNDLPSIPWQRRLREGECSEQDDRRFLNHAHAALLRYARRRGYSIAEGAPYLQRFNLALQAAGRKDDNMLAVLGLSS